MPTGIYKRKPRSTEYRANISRSRLERKKRLGYINSIDVRKKIAKALTGRKNGPPSEETKRKIGLANKGKKLSKKQRNLIRKLSIKRWSDPEFKKMMVEKYFKGRKGRLGQHLSKEHKIKLSIYMKKIFKNDPERSAKMNLAAFLKKPTSIETKLYEELKRRGLLFETQKLINGRFLVDAYIPSLNLIIEADGDYWHSLPRVKNRDKAKNAYLTKCGYKLLRLSETEINSGVFRDRLNFN